MRIAWLTPFANKSSIGRFSEFVSAAIARQVELDLWHPEAKEIRKAGVKRIAFSGWGEKVLSQLSSYDLVVYNLGNHLPFHREIFEISRRLPGIVILHDIVMHHFFAAYYLEECKDPQAYTEALQRAYGDRGKERAEAALAGKRKHIWETNDVLEFPFFEEAIRGCYGVVTHSAFSCDAVRKAFPGPVCRIPLAYEMELDNMVLSRSELAVPAEDILIVSSGHVNPNKRVHAVIEALAQSGGLGRRFTYAVLGPYDPAYYDQLRQLLRHHRLEHSVRFPGYVSDQVLRSYLVHADICANLRYPPTESASGSVLEQMRHAKPVVVTDTGFYSELPDDCVCKIHPDSERQELPAALGKLISDAQFRKSLGARAKDFAEREFRVSPYVKELLQFATEARRSKPVLELVDRLALELKQMGVHSGMEITETVSRECEDLFGSPTV